VAILLYIHFNAQNKKAKHHIFLLAPSTWNPYWKPISI
jgi:hypothetical protein